MSGTGAVAPLAIYWAESVYLLAGLFIGQNLDSMNLRRLRK